MVTMPQVRGRPLPYLKAWRMAKYLTQQMLAEKTGLAKATITRAETGVEVVSFANIQKIAQGLEITPDELVHQEPMV